VKGWLGQSDIVPGLAAAVAFLAFAFPVGLPLWLSFPLSVGVYLGLRFLLAENRPKEDEKVAEVIEQIRHISQNLGQDSASADIRAKVKELCDVSEQLLSTLRSRPEDTARELGLLQLYLELVRDPIRQFALLPHKDRRELVEGPAQQLGRTLDNATARFRKLLDEVMADNYAEFRATLEALDETFSISEETAFEIPRDAGSVEQPNTLRTNAGEGDEPR
jgi:hypothetical protein